MLCLRSHTSERDRNVGKGWIWDLEVLFSSFSSVILVAWTSEKTYFLQIKRLRFPERDAPWGILVMGGPTQAWDKGVKLGRGQQNGKERFSRSNINNHHQLPESTQTYVHWVSDAIQPSHPLSSPSPPAFNLSQHQGLFKWVSSLHQVAKVLEFQLQYQSFQWTPRTDLL